MRQRAIKKVSDTVFWYVIYLLPVICYILAYFRQGLSAGSLATFFETMGIPVLSDVVTETLTKIFGAEGILPLYGASVGIPIFSWYVSMMIIHLAVDFLLFIPRLAHKWMDKFCQDD